VIDPAAGEPNLKELRPRHHAVLLLGEIADEAEHQGLGDFAHH
jgi:hypothetical protein